MLHSPTRIFATKLGRLYVRATDTDRLYLNDTDPEDRTSESDIVVFGVHLQGRAHLKRNPDGAPERYVAGVYGAYGDQPPGWTYEGLHFTRSWTHHQSMDNASGAAYKALRAVITQVVAEFERDYAADFGQAGTQRAREAVESAMSVLVKAREAVETAEVAWHEALRAEAALHNTRITRSSSLTRPPHWYVDGVRQADTRTGAP